EPHRAEQRLDPGAHARDRMQPAAPAAPAGEGDVDRLLAQLPLERFVADPRALRLEQALDPRLGVVDAAPGLAPLLRRKLAQSLQQFGERAGAAQVTRLRILQRRRVCRGSELLLRFGYQRIDGIE